jgi:hypothetical protein
MRAVPLHRRSPVAVAPVSKFNIVPDANVGVPLTSAKAKMGNANIVKTPLHNNLRVMFPYFLPEFHKLGPGKTSRAGVLVYIEVSPYYGPMILC